MTRVGISGPMDRILRAGGMVLVTAVGALSLTAASGQAATMSANGGSVVVSAVGRVTTNVPTGEATYFQVNGVNAAWVTVSGISTGGVVTATGTSTNTFSGPVKVSGTAAVLATAIQVSATDTGGFNFLNSYRGSNRRFSVAQLDTSEDVGFYAVTGAGAGTGTESFRITNTGAYLVAATRVGVGGTPSYPAHIQSGVSGYGLLSTYAGWFEAPSATAAVNGIAKLATANAALFRQDAASATTPVVVVRMGATPSGSAQEWQNSGGAVVAKVGATGAISSNVFTNDTTVTAYNAYFRADASGVTPLAVRGAVSQTADLLQMQDNTGAVQTAFSYGGNPTYHGTGGASGGFITIRARASAPGTPASSYASLWYDNTAKAFKYIDDTGATRTVTAA